MHIRGKVQTSTGGWRRSICSTQRDVIEFCQSGGDANDVC